MPRVALVTSGLGTACGGIGVVAQMMLEALQPHAVVDVWPHDAKAPALRRAAKLAGIASIARRPQLVVYDHVDLARLSIGHPRLRRIPHVIFVHGTEVWRPMSGLRRLALLRASAVVANSHYTVRLAREHNAWFPDATVAPLGVEPPLRAHDGPRASPVALIASRMDAGERYKGHDAILDGWPTILSRVPEARLRIVGDGSDRARLEARVRDEHLRSVEFLGRVSDEQLAAEYEQARVFLFPSTREGFGLAAAEAAIRGVPVVAVRSSAVAEVLPDGAGAVLVDAPTGAQIADAAVPLLADAAAAARLGASGRARVQGQFLKAQFQARFLEALTRVLRTAGVP